MEAHSCGPAEFAGAAVAPNGNAWFAIREFASEGSSSRSLVDAAVANLPDDKQAMSDEGDEPPEPTSLLGLPIRLILGLASVGIPLSAIAVFSSSHEWPPPPSCLFAVFGCPSAQYPASVQPFDWAYLGGPLIGVVSAVTALARRKELGEGGILGMLFPRYVIPGVGLIVSIGAAFRVVTWMIGAGT